MYTSIQYILRNMHTVLLCFALLWLSFIINSHEVFIHIHQGCFAGTGAIVRLPQCQWSKPDGYGKISQCITTTKHSKAKTVCKFLGIYCIAFSGHDHILYSSTSRTCKCPMQILQDVFTIIPSSKFTQRNYSKRSILSNCHHVCPRHLFLLIHFRNVSDHSHNWVTT